VKKTGKTLFLDVVPKIQPTEDFVNAVTALAKQKLELE
jgi:hypothetical protein